MTGSCNDQIAKDVLSKALDAEVGGASVDLGDLFTDDVIGWSPYAMVEPPSPPELSCYEGPPRVCPDARSASSSTSR